MNRGAAESVFTKFRQQMQVRYFVVNDETTKSVFLERRNFSAAIAVKMSIAPFRGTILEERNHVPPDEEWQIYPLRGSN